jgi:drug/metabolite transporter (DMT)-like permease
MSPKLRESLYYLGTIITGVLGVALVWGGIDAGAAENIGDILAGFLALIGASAPAVAAKKVSEQRKDGTLDVVSPADAVVNGVQAVIQQTVSANAELERVKNAVTAAVGVVPGIGPLAQQVINSISTPYNR